MTTETYLRHSPLPNFPPPYCVIPHGYIIDKIRELCEKENLTIKHESFQAHAQGDEALSFILLEHKYDPDVEVSLRWINSYNKKIKFNCSIGGYIKQEGLPFVFHNVQSAWIRKHSGDALNEVEQSLTELISDINIHFDVIIREKNKLKNKILSSNEIASLLGYLYGINDILLISTFTNIKKWIKEQEIVSAWELLVQIIAEHAEMNHKHWHKTLTQTHYTMLNILCLFDDDDDELPFPTLVISTDDPEDINIKKEIKERYFIADPNVKYEKITHDNTLEIILTETQESFFMKKTIEV